MDEIILKNQKDGVLLRINGMILQITSCSKDGKPFLTVEPMGMTRIQEPCGTLQPNYHADSIPRLIVY